MKKLIKMFAAGWSAGNKKRIVISLSTIGIVAAMAVGVTVSYFQDKETSTGNKFQAGKLNLKIDNTCHYNGMICTGNVWAEESTGSAADADLIGTPCTCSWSAKDLANEMFFDFLDVKPGDIGEDTVSLHVDNNDAWVCAEITNLKNFENGCDSPEDKVDTATGSCGTGLTDPGEGKGELQDNLFFTIWKDTDCDNKLDGVVEGYCKTLPGSLMGDCSTGINGPVEQSLCDQMHGDNLGCEWVPAQASEQVLVENQKATSNSWPIADSSTGSGPIKGNETTCLGIAWNVPITATNIIQTDSFTGDVIFNAVQARNMKNFKCSDLYAEVCDGLDNDYDNLIDNGDAWINKGNACSVGDGACVVTGTLVCDANNPAGGLVCSATPGTPGTEIPEDGIDQDCNNIDAIYCYADNDGDGYGIGEKLKIALDGICNTNQQESSNNNDCDDGNSSINPGVTEVCNGKDDDCDGEIDDLTPILNPNQVGECLGSTQTCRGSLGWEVDYDNDPDWQTIETKCDSKDNDCDGQTDEGLTMSNYYKDQDSDGYGNADDFRSQCGPSGSYTVIWIEPSDCNDDDSNINPWATEVCDGIDNNCDGNIDESFSQQFHQCSTFGLHYWQCINGALACD